MAKDKSLPLRFIRKRPPFPLALLLLLMATGCRAAATGNEVPRALPRGELPNDARLKPLKDLEGYFPFTPCASPAEWSARSARVQRELAVALGLWPMPNKTPLNVVIHGKIARPGYTIEKVYFESVPGFFVTGNLYRPVGKSGRLPGVLCPHGHWANGRFFEETADNLAKDIANGAEKFSDGGRSPLQSICAQLARMGCVAFQYDMIGYADSVQISQAIAHGFAKQRPDMNSPNDWGLFSPQAEEHLQSVMGLQTWDSVRALDFLLSLPDVDPKRIGVTGASGGGTQTFTLCALDDRPAVAFPAVMVSTAMQGGCTCENACLLRVDTGNVEIAALFAPKPLGLTAANDWTKEMETKGFPELQKHYTMLGAPHNVRLTPLLQFGHNYNYVSRAAVYEWFNQHLALGLNEPIIEKDYPFSTPQELSVWDSAHPKPEGGPEFERKLLRWITDRDAKQLESCQDSPARYREVYGGGFDVILGRDLQQCGAVELARSNRVDCGSYWETTGLLRNVTHAEELPLVILESKKTVARTAIWLSQDGKRGLYAPDDSKHLSPRVGVRTLLDAGVTVIGADLLFQGESLADGQTLTRTRKVKNAREAAAYTFGYNYTLFAQRVHDVLSVIQFSRARLAHADTIDVIGMDGAGAWALAAKAQSGDAVHRVAIDTGGFRFGNITDLQDVNFLPGAAKYGDLPGLLALAAPGKIWVTGEKEAGLRLPKKMYGLANAGQNLTVGASGRRDEEAVLWLLERKRIFPLRDERSRF